MNPTEYARACIEKMKRDKIAELIELLPPDCVTKLTRIVGPFPVAADRLDKALELCWAQIYKIKGGAA